MGKKRTGERAALAEAIERRNDAEAAYKKHEAAYDRAIELAREAATAVTAAEAEIEKLKAEAHQHVMAALYDGEIVLDETQMNAAQRRLSDARDREAFYAEAAKAVEARKDEAAGALRRAEAGVERAARVIIADRGDVAIERMYEAEREAWRAKALVKSLGAFARDPTDTRADSPLLRMAGAIVWGGWPGSGNISDTMRMADAVKACWSEAFEALKRDPDAALPE